MNEESNVKVPTVENLPTVTFPPGGSFDHFLKKERGYEIKAIAKIMLPIMAEIVRDHNLNLCNPKLLAKKVYEVAEAFVDEGQKYE